MSRFQGTETLDLDTGWVGVSEAISNCDQNDPPRLVPHHEGALGTVNSVVAVTRIRGRKREAGKGKEGREVEPNTMAGRFQSLGQASEK